MSLVDYLLNQRTHSGVSPGKFRMDKTVDSFRVALEGEIGRWDGFARALRKPDREAFDELMDLCRSYVSESSCATTPIVFEPMVMSVLLGQQKQMRTLQRKLDALLVSTLPIEKVGEGNDFNQ